MAKSSRTFLLFALASSLFLLATFAQDSPDSQSLGDVARQARQQKQQQQSKTAQAKDPKGAKAPKVITNEEIPSSSFTPATTGTYAGEAEHTGAPHHENAGSIPPDAWKSHILTAKNNIAQLQKQIDEVQDSIKFAPANCVSGCVAWNERQRQKQQQIERMQAQLEEMKKNLEEMQEAARKQGYGSSVYDP